MDPALAYYQLTWQILYSTCVKLTNYKDVTGDAGRVIYPEAATSMPDVSSDGLTYTYTVPPGRFKFNTGEPVTAESFQHALERDLNPNQASYFGSVFLSPVIKGASDYKGKAGEHVSGIEVQGDKLIIHLVAPDAGLISKLTTPFACAVSKDLPVDSKGVHEPPMAGPYYISSFSPNRSIVLKKNPNWTDAAGFKRPAYLDEIDYVALTENTDQGTLQIKNGELDYSPDALSPAQYFQLNKEFGPNGTSGGDQRFFITPQAAVSYLALNTTRPAFSNPLVRQAVNYAIDRPAIAQASGYGAATPAEKYLPPQIAGSQQEQVVYPVDSIDLSKAKSLMQQAGVSTPINAVLYDCNQAPCPDRAAIIQQNLKAIGINVEIKLFDRGVQFGKEGTKGEPFDIAVEGWVADYYDAYDFLNILLYGKNIPATNGNNFSYIDDPQLNASLEHANTLTGDGAQPGVRRHRDQAEAAGRAGTVGATGLPEQHRLLQLEGRLSGQPGLVRHGPELLLHPPGRLAEVGHTSRRAPGFGPAPRVR